MASKVRGVMILLNEPTETSMGKTDYREYLRREELRFYSSNTSVLDQILPQVSHLRIERVVDVGCGAGQELLPFAEDENVFCVGIDVEEVAGDVFTDLFIRHGLKERAAFVRARGEKIPFGDDSFDIAMCRVALPYMNNRDAIAEMARVVRPGGILFLRTHNPKFYLGMIRRRSQEYDLKGIVYPLICLLGGVFHWFTGKQLENGIWRGKEIFQIPRMLERELQNANMKIIKNDASPDGETRSLIVRKAC